jgi:hypothetical protein
VSGRVGCLVVWLAVAAASSAWAQNFTYRGFAEERTTAYPQEADRDPAHLGVEGHARVEPAYRPFGWLTFASSFDARIDNLGQVERSWRIDFRDRGLQRPALSIRQAEALLRSRRFTVDLGKQFIRWGKTDILTPTDRFAPRDFLEVTDADWIAVTGARVQYTRGMHSVDIAAVPTFTPSRIPLLDRRWAALPPDAGSVTLVDLGSTFPERGQFGARWSITAPGCDFSLSYFDGFNHLPQTVAVPLSGRQVIGVSRSYVPLRMAGGDAAVPLPWFTVKGEAALMTTTSRLADDVVLYVIQLERQAGELSVVAGYAGEIVTTRRSDFAFAPDRGLTRAFLVRTSYTLDPNRSVSVEGALRQSLDGVWVKAEYSQARGAHWRATVSATVIGGTTTDFFGQYGRNSHLLATLRYSF